MTAWESRTDAQRIAFQQKAASICAKFKNLTYDAVLSEWVPKNLTVRQQQVRLAGRRAA